MRYSDILAKFLSMFPSYAERVSHWAPAGRNGIKLRLDDDSGLLFTYTNDRIWNLESIAGYAVRRG